MVNQMTLTHHIQKYIVETLMYQKAARFRDLRPPKTDTNLFSYHLKALIKSGLVEKSEQGYSLSTAGLSYVDRVSTESHTVRSQPKIVTMLLVQNSDGQVLLQKRSKQPYIDTWTLPYGKLHIEDATLEKAAMREALEKLNLKNAPVCHVGDCYIRVMVEGDILSTTLAHIFRFETDEVKENERLKWVEPLDLATLPLAPAVEQIVARAFFHDQFFFEEYEQQWLSEVFANPAVDRASAHSEH